MKTLPGLLLAMALASAAASAASAYSLSPPDASAKLTGILTLTPTSGGTPVRCKVLFRIRTKKNQIISAQTVDNTCNDVGFAGVPWGVGILSANTGQFGRFSFGGVGRGCSQAVVVFQDNSSGVWTLPTGQCISGTLTSHPPITIVP